VLCVLFFEAYHKVSIIIQILYKKISLKVKLPEAARLIAEMDEKDENIVFGMIETMLTKKKFKDFFQKNIAAL
jgi:hypothetical protein